MKNKSIIFIVGQTASGKTNTAIKVALEVDGEIICADSQTVRKELNIGTAKPSAEEQESVPHHLINLIEPYERYSVAQFKSDATKAVQDIQSRGKIPIIVGGTGLYIDSIFFDYDLENEASIDRLELEKMSVTQLQNIIIEKGYELPPNKDNPRHLIGVIARKGEVSKNIRPIENALIFGINKEDEVLKKRIGDRVEKMFVSGLVEEVRQITEKFGKPPRELDAICYPIVQRYLDNEISLETAKEVFKRADWQYARRQKAWFKRNRFIQWFPDENTAVNAIIYAIESI